MNELRTVGRGGGSGCEMESADLKECAKPCQSWTLNPKHPRNSPGGCSKVGEGELFGKQGSG